VPNDDKKVTWLIEHTVGARSWSFVKEFEFRESGSAKSHIAQLRYDNDHRDDNTRAQTRPCVIWTKDGTWASYESAPTYYRLVKITREVVDEDKPETN
jgi:hypothetical protein